MTTGMDPEGILLSEINQTKTNTVQHHYVWNLKKKKKKSNSQKERAEKSLQVIEGRGNRERLVKEYKL